MRGINNNTIVAIIVVVIVIIVAIVVLALVLGQHRSSSGPASSSMQQGALNLIVNNSTGSSCSQGSVEALGPAMVTPYYMNPHNEFVVAVTLYSSVCEPVTITGVTLNGVPASVAGGNTVIYRGTQTLTFTVSTTQGVTLESGTQVQIELFLSNGFSVPISAVVQ